MPPDNGFQQRGFILRAAFIITAATLLSKVLGLVRFQIIFYLFGVGPETDAFWSGFRIPNTMRDLLAEGAFSTVFVMICTRVMIHKGKEAVIRFTNQILSLFSIFIFGVCVILYLLGQPFLDYGIIGLYHFNEGTLPLVAQVFEILLPFLFILALASLFMGLLNSHEKYWAPAIAPFVSNVLFIIAMLFLGDSMGIAGIAVAYICGALGQLGIQFIVSLRLGWRFRWEFTIKDPYVREFLILYIPILTIIALPKIVGFITNGYATALGEDQLSIFEWAYIIIQLPVSIFVTGISIVSLTNLSKYYEAQDWYNFRALLTMGLRVMLMFAVPGMVLLLLLSEQTARFFYKDFADFITGNFNTRDYVSIGMALFYLAPSLISISLTVIFLRAYQGMKEWKRPLIVSVIMVGMHLVLANLLAFHLDWGLVGIIVSYIIVSYTSCILFGILLIHKTTGPDWEQLLRTFFHTAVGSMVMGAYVYAMLQLIGGYSHPLANIIFVGGIYISALLVYSWFMIFFKEEEFLMIFQKLMGRVIGTRRR
jgi:putative peptidoglycan lipid II flippase